jgi:hypothetical protein
MRAVRGGSGLSCCYPSIHVIGHRGHHEHAASDFDFALKLLTERRVVTLHEQFEQLAVVLADDADLRAGLLTEHWLIPTRDGTTMKLTDNIVDVHRHRFFAEQFEFVIGLLDSVDDASRQARTLSRQLFQSGRRKLRQIRFDLTLSDLRDSKCFLPLRVDTVRQQSLRLRSGFGGERQIGAIGGVKLGTRRGSHRVNKDHALMHRDRFFEIASRRRDHLDHSRFQHVNVADAGVLDLPGGVHVSRVAVWRWGI